MKRSVFIFLCFVLTSPAAMADKARSGAGGASPIEQFPGSEKAQPADPASSGRQPWATEEKFKRPKVLLPASSARAKPGASVRKQEAPKIKARAVIGGSGS